MNGVMGSFVLNRILLLVTGCWSLASGCWQLVAGFWLLVAGFWLLVTGYLLLVACSWSPVKHWTFHDGTVNFQVIL